MITKLKRCTNPKCKNPLKSEFEFNIDRSRPNGLSDRCKECIKEYDDKRKQIQRNQYLEREYGFLPGGFEKISKSQNDKCLVCKQERKLVSDHCHKTYRNRGFLCNSCNSGLGGFDDNPNLLMEAIKHLSNKIIPYESKFADRNWTIQERRRNYLLEYYYMLLPGHYEMILKSQDNRCNICKQEKKFEIDHCHITGKVRGLLCQKCNTALGKFNDDSKLLRKAADYIESF